MAMLHWYAEQSLAFPLYVAHVHHGLRTASDDEETLVRAYCNARSLPLTVFHADVKDEMQKGETVESAARRIRYGFFRSLARETGATHLATAHTEDDQCETVLLHLLHGAGPKGLCGILPKRQQEDLTLIRPLIACPKREILSYCAQNEIPFALDESNQDLSYTRNRIRHRLLPEMEKINPNVRRSVCRAATALQRQQQGVEARAKEFLDAHGDLLPADEMRKLPKGEQAEILRQAFQELGKQLTFEQTEQALCLLEKETASAEFDRSYLLHLGQNRIAVRKKTEPLPQISIEREETVLPDGRILRLTEGICTEETRREMIPKTLPLTLRPRKQGDTLRTSGGTKTLKKRMVELKIPQPARDSLWVLADQDRVLWCEALGSNQETAPKENERGYFISLSEK